MRFATPRNFAPMLVAALALALPSLPAAARQQNSQRYEYNGRYYNTVAQCQAAKNVSR